MKILRFFFFSIYISFRVFFIILCIKSNNSPENLSLNLQKFSLNFLNSFDISFNCSVDSTNLSFDSSNVSLTHLNSLLISSTFILLLKIEIRSNYIISIFKMKEIILIFILLIQYMCLTILGIFVGIIFLLELIINGFLKLKTNCINEIIIKNEY